METKTTRKPHTKSRKGCDTCKRRHVRCDENLPRCHNCNKGNRLCHYTPTSSDSKHESDSTTAREGWEDLAGAATSQATSHITEFESQQLFSPSCHDLYDGLANSTPQTDTWSLDPYGFSSVPISAEVRDQLNYCEP